MDHRHRRTARTHRDSRGHSVASGVVTTLTGSQRPSGSLLAGDFAPSFRAEIDRIVAEVGGLERSPIWRLLVKLLGR